MVRELEVILDDVAKDDEIPYVIAEIPTNPRVEIPDLEKLREVLNRREKIEREGMRFPPLLFLTKRFVQMLIFWAKMGSYMIVM